MYTPHRLRLTRPLVRANGLATFVLALAAGLGACDEQGPTSPSGSPASDEEISRSAGSASASALMPAIGDGDLVAIKKWSTASGTTELHALSRNSLYQSFSMQTGTVLHPTDGLWAFAVADWDDDDPNWFRLDVVGIKKANTGSGHTEVHVLSGKDNYSKFLHQWATALPETGGNYEFAIADWNKDHYYDLIAVKKNGTGTGRTEIHILSGATGFQTYLLQIGTALPATDVSWTFQVADWDGRGTPDLIGVKRSGTASGRTEVHILSGESNFQQFVLRVATPIEQTMFNWSFLVQFWDNDYVPDLIGVKRANTGTGKTEVHVLSGASRFQGFLQQTGTALGPTGAEWTFATAVPRIHLPIN